MSDNGDLRPEEKAPEQLVEERLKRYQADPHSFIEIGELICGAIRDSKSAVGVSVAVFKCKRTELDIAQAELNHSIQRYRMALDVSAQVKEQSIVQPKGSMFNF